VHRAFRKDIINETNQQTYCSCNRITRALCFGSTAIDGCRGRRSHLGCGFATGDLDAIKQRLADGQDINAKAPSVGLTPLMAAAITGQTDAAKLLLDEGANPNLKSSNDGATALHMAAFFGHIEIVKALLGRGADTKILNDRSETPLDTVRGDWSDELEGFYKLLGGMLKLELDLAKSRLLVRRLRRCWQKAVARAVHEKKGDGLSRLVLQER
jgi:hypothetical protein